MSISKAYGSLEGILQAIDELQFCGLLCERLTDTHIKCIFAPEVWPMARMARQKRVYLFGILYYDEQDRIFCLFVQEIEIFPPDKFLPRFADIVGTFKRK